MQSMVRRSAVDIARQLGNAASVILLTLGASSCLEGGDSDPDDTPTAYRDADGDLILDIHEGVGDTDVDGAADYLDKDSDGDGISDALEAGDSDVLTFPVDSDWDGLHDFRDPDSDNNGIPDALEVGLNPSQPLDFDGDGLPDFRDADNDGDAISDAIELGGGVPLDTDRDGVPDYMDVDSDDDLILDVDEAQVDASGVPADTDGDGLPDYRDLDSDDDGFDDSEEAGDSLVGTAPRDTDQDGSPDFVDLDSDGDALSELEEVALGTDPYLYDTDSDGYSDGAEVLAQSNPTNASSRPYGLYATVPERSEATYGFQFQADIARADVIFLLDSTGSMGPSLNALATDFGTVVSDVGAQIPDAAFGVGTFQDYNASGMGGTADRPFQLEHQITTDRTAVQNTLSSLTAGGGGDLSETPLEALFQAAIGKGYDQNCNAVFDSSTDVPPFIADVADVFGGTKLGTYSATDVSSGTLGGVGIRPYALPIFVYTTDAPFRDPDDGDPVPGACGNSAGRADAIAAVNAVGGKLIGINAGTDANVIKEMQRMAEATYSTADVNGDGIPEPLVFSSQGGGEIVDNIVQGISAFHATGEFQRVELIIEGDTWGFVDSIEPPFYSHVKPGQALEFSISFFGASPAAEDDTLYSLRLMVVGDGAASLASQMVIIIVPGV